MGNERGNFTGKLGFVLAAAGSAVGLGNIWRFPYLAAQHGGGMFLLVYLILAVTFGFALMCGEIALGRKTGLSAIGAFKALNKKYAFIGYLAAIVPMIILPYYSVIGGWVMKYLAVFLSGQGTAAAGDKFFGGFVSQTIQPIGWFAGFIGITALVVLFGVEKGVEKVSKIMMPILIVLSIIIAAYSLTIKGAMEGLKFYLIPDFKHFSVTTVLGAMGQLFYSMSLAMGIMVTYGSYMKKDVNLEKSVRQIEIFDTGIAFLAGLMIIPATVAVSPGGIDALEKPGPSLMFETLPKVFNGIPGGAGMVIGALFFLMVLFAALTSSISLMETVVSIFCDKFKWNRKFACIMVLIGSFLIGLPSTLGFGIWDHVEWKKMNILSLFDFMSNSVLMPIVAFFTCLFIGYVIKPKTVIEEIELSAKFKSKALFTVVIKYIAPICILLILGFSILEGFGIITV